MRGGIYPVTNTDPEVLRGMPYLEVTNGGVPRTTDLGGTYDYAPPSSLATGALDGDFVTVSDDCGAASLATSFTPGDLSFGVGAGTDCTTPGYGGAGNTHAARSTYYHVNLIKEKARQYLNDDPATMTPWLDADLTANVNIAQPCNAYWGGGTINFYRSADGVGYDCSNTGEIAAVFLHEFGHGLDQNTNGAPPDKGSGEAYGDTMAFLQTHDSCIGNNFKPGFACQSGCDATCTGVRDVDVAPEATPANIVSGSTDCLGTRTKYDGTTITLVCPTFGYQGPMGTVFLALDDDNGDLADGTPNADLLWTAFHNHGIACGGSAPPVGSTCAALTAPALTATPSTGQVDLSWTAVAGAASLCEGFAHDDASLVWDFGGGLEASVGGGLDLRFDLRDLVADDLYGAGTTHNLQVTVGLTARLP